MEVRSQHGVVTPEAVAVSLDVAGPGSRMIAAALDLLIQVGLVLALALASAAVGSIRALARPVGIGFLLGVFLILFGYHPILEGLWSGRTVGKRATRLRVVQGDGQPVGLASVLVRNLVRIIDFLPGFYGVGLLAMLLTPRSQRLGDLAAGTLVVREPRLPVPAPLPASTGVPAAADALAAIDAAGLSEREYAVIRSFLERRDALEPAARADLASRIATAVRPRVGMEAGASVHDEVFLEAVARAFRARFAQPGRAAAEPPS